MQSLFEYLNKGIENIEKSDDWDGFAAEWINDLGEKEKTKPNFDAKA